MPGDKELMKLDEKAWYDRMLIENVLATGRSRSPQIQQPGAILEVALLSDIVLAIRGCARHYALRGMVPGDSQQHVLS